MNRRMLSVMLAYAVIHVVGWVLFAVDRAHFPAAPDPTNSLLLAFIVIWAGESRK